jgi:hypothetical protein
MSGFEGSIFNFNYLDGISNEDYFVPSEFLSIDASL